MRILPGGDVLNRQGSYIQKKSKKTTGEVHGRQEVGWEKKPGHREYQPFLSGTVTL
jgi:hypothetical protein